MRTKYISKFSAYGEMRDRIAEQKRKEIERRKAQAERYPWR